MQEKRFPNGLLCRDITETGSKLQMVSHLRRSVPQMLREGSNVVGYYVGIASGDEVFRALRRRYDKYKKANGLCEMVAVYASSSEENTRHVETEIEEYCTASDSRAFKLNRRGGGGGRKSSGPVFFLYLALWREADPVMREAMLDMLQNLEIYEEE